MRRLLAVLALTLGLACASPALAADGTGGSIVQVGHDVRVDRPVERVVTLGGDVRLGPHARVSGDVIVLFGTLEKAPGARIGGSELVLDRSLIDWIPGPGWVAAVVLVVLLLLYRAAVWLAVTAVAGTVVRTATYERWSRGWEGRPLVALLLGLVAVAIVLPALAVIAATGFLLPVALIGLAGLLLAAGVGLAMLREGPLWPRRPSRLAYAAYLILPPALEVGLIITAAAGLGAALRLPARRRATA
jgi:hypothetical protein